MASMTTFPPFQENPRPPPSPPAQEPHIKPSSSPSLSPSSSSHYPIYHLTEIINSPHHPHPHLYRTPSLSFPSVPSLPTLDLAIVAAKELIQLHATEERWSEEPQVIWMRGKEFCMVIVEEDGGCVVVYVEKEEAVGMDGARERTWKGKEKEKIEVGRGGKGKEKKKEREKDEKERVWGLQEDNLSSLFSPSSSSSSSSSSSPEEIERGFGGNGKGEEKEKEKKARV